MDKDQIVAEGVANSALSCLVSEKSRGQCTASALAFTQCQLLNISYCQPTEETKAGKSLVIVVYNPLGWNRTDIVRIPVNDGDLVVSDSAGNTIQSQYVRMDNVTRKLRNFYLKAYIGKSINPFPKYWLVFPVSVPPLGWNTYFITNAPDRITKWRHGLSMNEKWERKNFEIGPGKLKMSFSSITGQLTRIYNSRTGVDIPVQQSYSWYESTTDSSQYSGAYIFRPDGSPPAIAARSVSFTVNRGSVVHEVYQQFNSWIHQTTRLYKDKEHAEIEFTIGPIPIDDSVGKEVITQMTSNMVTDKVFYTDSNGRDFLQRIRDHRADWNLSVNQPQAGNYYPINLGMYIVDKKSELSVLVDRAVGGASIADGQVELMLHRRMLYDDGRGVDEVLDESVCDQTKCEGLTVRGKFYLSVNKLGAGSSWRRTTGQEIYSPLLLAFAHEKAETWKSSYATNGTAMDPGYSLPLNVALITLQELDNGSVLLRLAHLYEGGEDSTYSGLAKVELKKMFAGKRIKDVKEMSLSANQGKSEMKKMKWKVEGDNNGDEVSPVRGGTLDPPTLVVELGPMEIRTFLLKF